MLSNIRISNFKSIVDLDLDLTFAEGKAPNGFKDSEELFFLEATNKPRDRVSPLMCLYGANASGKSNVIKGLFVFLVIIQNGLGDNQTLPRLKPFYNKTNFLNTGSVIDISFYTNGKKFNYALEFTAEKIIHEKLICNDNTLFEVKDSKLIDISIQSKVNDKEFLERLLFESLNQDNQVNTFLTTVYKRLPNLNNDLSDVANYMNKFVVLGDNNVSQSFALDYLAKSKEDGKLKDALGKIANIIQKLDIDIDRFEFNRQDLKANTAYNPSYISFADKQKPEEYEIITIHKDCYGNDINFKLQEESHGTQLLFAIIGVMIRVLEDGNIMIVDELDKSLHPELTKTILEVFKSKEYNVNNSQLITTLHSTDVLEAGFRTSEFAFVSKNIKYGTKIKRLSSFETRQDINFRDRYIAGMYRAKPNTQI